MILLCSFLDLWNHLVMTIGSTTSKLKMGVVVVALLSREMWQKAFKYTKETLAIHEGLKEKGKEEDKKKENYKSNSDGRSKSLGKSMAKCWNCSKI